MVAYFSFENFYLKSRSSKEWKFFKEVQNFQKFPLLSPKFLNISPKILINQPKIFNFSISLHVSRNSIRSEPCWWVMNYLRLYHSRCIRHHILGVIHHPCRDNCCQSRPPCHPHPCSNQHVQQSHVWSRGAHSRRYRSRLLENVAFLHFAPSPLAALACVTKIPGVQAGQCRPSQCRSGQCRPSQCSQWAGHKRAEMQFHDLKMPPMPPRGLKTKKEGHLQVQWVKFDR